MVRQNKNSGKTTEIVKLVNFGSLIEKFLIENLKSVKLP